MKQNLNFLNYEAVAAELSSYLVELDSPVAMRTSMTRAQKLAEFRTIGFNGCRQTGKTRFIHTSAAKNPSETIIVFAEKTTREQFIREWDNLNPGVPMPVLWAGPLYQIDKRRGMSPVLKDEPQFRRVYIDNATTYFNMYRHGELYRALGKLCYDDVIITHVG
jgi:hypothetical protein